MVGVDGDTIIAGHRFRCDQLLLLLYPTIHIRVWGLRPPPSEGLRGPLRGPLRRPRRRPRASWAVGTVGATARLMHSHGSFPRSSVSMLCPTLSQQCTGAKAGFKGRLS